MTEVAIVRTVDVVAAEINALTASMLNDVIEIGRRMCEAKEMLPHGAFGKWIEENTGYSSSTANNFMRLFREYAAPQGSLFGAEANCQTIGKLSYGKALALLSLPAEERENFVEANNVEAMTTRELRQAIKERDEALQRVAKAEEDVENISKARDDIGEALQDSQRECRELKDRVKELEERPVEVAVQEADPEEVEKVVDAALAKAAEQHKTEMDELRAKLDKQVKKAEKLERAVEKAKAASGEDEKNRLAGEVERLSKQLAMAGTELTTFKVYFAAWQQAYAEMMRSLAAVPGEDGTNCARAVKAQVEAWSKA